MTDLILCYITCSSLEEARKIGRHLLKSKLAGCINVYPDMTPMFFWPPKSGKIDESKEVTLIAKTIEGKYQALEEEIIKIHSFDTPCVIAIPTTHVSKKYYDWIVSELE
jgi:periplasmic divalent cation tolerance protein